MEKGVTRNNNKVGKGFPEYKICGMEPQIHNICPLVCRDDLIKSPGHYCLSL